MRVRDFIEKNYPEYYGWFDYPVDRTVFFSSADGEWGILGNFGRTPLVIDGVPFPCAESVFQIMKFADPEARISIYLLKGQRIKMRAKHFEREVGVRPDWGEILVDALKFCLMSKYEQSEAFRDELSRTGDRFIVEMQPNPQKKADTYSAKLSQDGLTWSGPNLMGRLLMELRDNGKLEYKLPEDAVLFPDLKEFPTNKV
jgi:predicted NAD-dependent protein-ADP-ribosyltransferase YbiA (DUF1768 family)